MISSPLKRGDAGEAVRALQQRLTALGFPAKADGEFGPATEKAVRDFQRSRGLAVVSGMVDGYAAAALNLHEQREATAPMKAAEPRWLSEARRFTGLRELPGAANDATIMSWPRRIAARHPSLAWALQVFTGDVVPWCGLFVGAVMSECGFTPPGAYPAAKNWLQFGVPLDGPAIGAIAVFGRAGGGHVGFVVGKDQRGNLMVLGGNQGDMVKVSPFSWSRVEGYRWPKNMVLPATGKAALPIVTSDGRLSVNER